MNQLIVKSFGSPDKVRAYAGALRNATRNISGGDERDILKIDDGNGDWSFGQENEPVARDDLWAVNPITIKHGYIAFDGREVAETVDGERAEILLSVLDELPDTRDLPELDIRSKKNRESSQGWKFFMQLEMVCVEGTNKGAEVVYKPASMGGLRACRTIAEEIARRFEDDANETHVPVVELDARPYHNKRYGKEIFNPRLEVVDWASVEDTSFSSGKREAKGDDTKSRKADTKAGKADGARGNGRERGGDDDDARRSAREARKTETDRRGEKVDSRKAVEHDHEDEDGEPVAEARGRRGGKSEVDDREEPRGRRGGRDRDEDQEDAREGRRQDAKAAPAETRGRRGARDRDEDDRQPEEDAPRGRRGRDDEDDRRSSRDDAPRGRRAAAGGRR